MHYVPSVQLKIVSCSSADENGTTNLLANGSYQLIDRDNPSRELGIVMRDPTDRLLEANFQ